MATLNEVIGTMNLFMEGIEKLEALMDKHYGRYPCGQCQLTPGKCGSTRRICAVADRVDDLIASGEAR